jgi:intein/homing endonuclease
MAKAEKETNQRDLSYKGCYGSVVSYTDVFEFLETSFFLNRLAESHGDSRYASCLWGHAGVGKCVSGDTLVRTKKGVVEISTLFTDIDEEGFYPTSGLEVSTPEGFKPVKALYFSGVKRAVKITTNFGRTLTGSLIHPVLAAGDKLQWKPMSEITVGNYVAISDGGGCISKKTEEEATLPKLMAASVYQKADFRVPGKMNPKLAFVLGALVGEGCVSGDILSFTQDSDKPLARDFCKSFKDVFGLSLSETPDTRTDNTVGYRCHRTLLRSWFELIGLDRSKSRDKTIPWSVLQSSRKSQVAFLKALYEGEGSNEHIGISLSSSSIQLLEQVLFLLLGFGIQGAISKREVGGRDYWNLLCSGENGRRLNDLIGFSRASGHWLSVKKGNANKGGIPTELAFGVLKLAKTCHLSNGGTLSKKAVHSSPLNRLYNPKHSPETVSREFVLSVLSLFDKRGDLSDIIDPILNFGFERIVAIEEVGDIPLYDVSMDTEDHVFLPNGFVSHNTALTKQFANRPVEWNGHKYDGYKVFDVTIAQFEEMGDLHGVPMDCVLMKQPSKKEKDTFVTQWVPQKDEIIRAYRENGWDIDSSVQPTMQYAPPAWVPQQPGPSIVLLDDWNRASIRIVKGIMQLLQNYGMVSWQLPLGCNIVLTGNPDEQDYLVTTIDTAILTRIRHVTLKEDMAEWAVWADANKLDPRVISYALRYPEMITGPGRERTNPRTLAEFGRVLSAIGNDPSQRERIVRHGMALMDEKTVSNMMVFFEREMEMVIEPESILKGDEAALKFVEGLMGRKEPRVDIVNVIGERLYARIVQPDCKIDKERVGNFHKFLELDCIPDDLRHGVCRRIAKRGDPETNKWLIGSNKLKKVIMSTLRVPASV